ncbi:MAG: aromatic amino acid transport family protein [Patescibacteria group bacterium]|nr:aromatic amino acid transport family protein [Patescibacteria group bacterium]
MGKNSVLAIGLLAGTIIGAGIFSLPYIVSRLGILSGFFYLIAFALIYFFIHFMYAEIIKAGSEKHQFFYFAEKYLSKKIAHFASWVVLAGLVFALTVYLILAPTFFEIAFGISANLAVFIFWFLGSVFMFARLNVLGWAEVLGIVGIFSIIFIVLFSSFGLELKTPIFQKIDLPLFLLPFGPLLFSLAGRSAIPEVVAEYKSAAKQGKVINLKKVIFWGTIIPVIVYGFFIVSVLKISPQVSPESLDSLTGLSPTLFSLLGIMGLITLWTSYFVIGINVKDILSLDLKYPKFISALIVLIVPPLFYFLGIRNFLETLSIAGGVFVALESIFVVMMWQKAFPTSKWRQISFLLYAVFIAAIVYQFINFVF